MVVSNIVARIRTPDGAKVLYTGRSLNDTFLTVEVGPKWYRLYLVEQGAGMARPIEYEDMTLGDNFYGLTYVDHLPNPSAVAECAIRLGVRLSPIAFGAMVQAWGDETGQWLDLDDEELVDEALVSPLEEASREQGYGDEPGGCD